MEKVARNSVRFVGTPYAGRVNHAGFWDGALTVLTLGVSDLVKGEAKNSRVAIQKREYEILLQGLITFYENPTIAEKKIYTADGWVVLKRADFLNDKNLPSPMIDKTVNPVKPTYAAYVWAQVQDNVIFRGLTPAQAEARTGNIMKFQPIEFGKMDWATILKQAGVMILAIAGTIVTGGIAAPAAIGAVKSAIDIQKTADLINKWKPLTTVTVESAKEQEAKILAAQQAALDANKKASFLSFENPTFIMIAMAIGALVLFVAYKKFHK